MKARSLFNHQSNASRMNHRIKDSSMYEEIAGCTQILINGNRRRFSEKRRIFERSSLPESQKSFLLLRDQLLLLRASFSLNESAFCPHAKNFISRGSFGKPPADFFGALQRCCTYERAILERSTFSVSYCQRNRACGQRFRAGGKEEIRKAGKAASRLELERYLTSAERSRELYPPAAFSPLRL